MCEANNIIDNPNERAADATRGSQSESGEPIDGDYYYDDSTGYEVYREDEDESVTESEVDESDDPLLDV
jgi:hypothetical protein